MKKIFYIFIIYYAFITVAWSGELTCPREYQIKNVKFIEAIQHAHDADLWDFNSLPFIHHGKQWQVQFGTFLSDVKTKKEALIRGQTYFNQSQIIIKKPKPIEIPHFIYCEYVPTGRLYWISALSPLGKLEEG